MRHEIFGPILPVKTYARARRGDRRTSTRTIGRWRCIRSRNDARDGRAHPRRARSPAASPSTTRWCISACTTLPFGGIGPSGMGAIHGKRGLRHLQQVAAGVPAVALGGDATCCGRRTRDSSTGWCASSRVRPARAGVPSSVATCRDRARSSCRKRHPRHRAAVASRHCASHRTGPCNRRCVRRR